jgi:hypothetical protein
MEGSQGKVVSSFPPPPPFYTLYKYYGNEENGKEGTHARSEGEERWIQPPLPPPVIDGTYIMFGQTYTVCWMRSSDCNMVMQTDDILPEFGRQTLFEKDASEQVSISFRINEFQIQFES